MMKLKFADKKYQIYKVFSTRSRIVRFPGTLGGQSGKLAWLDMSSSLSFKSLLGNRHTRNSSK